MDKSRLLTIVITAVITATVTTVVKWFLELAGKLPMTAKLKETARKTFNKSVLVIMGNVFMILMSIGLLIYELKKTTPITRKDVFLIVIDTISIFLWMAGLSFALGVLKADKYLRERDRPRGV